MKLTEIRGDTAFQDVRPFWESLCQQSNVSSFLTWEWAAAWLATYSDPNSLCMLAAWDTGGALRGIAPLRAQTLRRYGQRAPSFLFVGDGSNDSDYLDFILARGYEEPVMKLFWDRLKEDLRAGTILQLNEIPETSASLPLLKHYAQGEKAIWVESDVTCATVPLHQEWNEYLASLKPRFRTKVRSVLRNLEGREEVRFGFCESAEDISNLLPKLFDLHGRRWGKQGQAGVFGWDRKRDFYARLSPALLDRGWLRTSWLEWNGHVLACQYGFVYGQTYFQLQEGYEPAAEHLNLGIGLRAWSIRELQRQGIREYDFMGGAKRGKLDWGASLKQSKQILIADSNWKSRLICLGPQWEDRTRERVKGVLPAKVVAARSAWLFRKPVPETAADGGWLRKAAANCYYHLRLPGLLRPLRDRYQLARNATSRSLERRTQPSARILYYHRVNNDGDPFFPAISTAQFERDMRYLSRHYTVVSIRELLDRLQGGSPEPTLAITFDDGYEDNYQNAFPILERYGLPATIFLTTGSLDSQQPLWFEALANALKNTTREHLDVECDFPRHFFLRNPQERMQANGDLFTLLRRMSNQQRNEHLADILKQLGVPADQERTNKMLTWDQVRLMNTHNITFGGHTVTHPFLSRLTQEELAWEVSECKLRIEQELQNPVAYFAYPNGRDEDFCSWNKDLLYRAGYRAAMTTKWGLNYASTDPMELRRGGPWEQSTAQFAYKLDYYQWTND